MQKIIKNLCANSWIKNNYNNIEVIITENGWSDEGQLDDYERIDYLKVKLINPILFTRESVKLSLFIFRLIYRLF